jgi:translation initiation factor 4E
MSASPAPVLDFFFDCGPPPQHCRTNNNLHAYNKQYKPFDDNYSHSTRLIENNSTDFFDLHFNDHSENKTKSDMEINVHSPPLSQKLVEHLEEFKYTGLMLNSPWTLWVNRFVPNLTKEEFEINLRNIYSISTVKTFWNVFNHMPSPSLIKPQYSFHLMRENIRPVWEDESNANGGMWKLRCPKKHTDTVWQELLLACVGEQFLDDVSTEDEILGLSVSVRKNDDLIQVWNLNSSAVEDSTVIQKINKLCPYVQFETSFYKPHHSYWSKNKSM